MSPRSAANLDNTPLALPLVPSAKAQKRPLATEDDADYQSNSQRASPATRGYPIVQTDLEEQQRQQQLQFEQHQQRLHLQQLQRQQEQQRLYQSQSLTQQPQYQLGVGYVQSASFYDFPSPQHQYQQSPQQTVQPQQQSPVTETLGTETLGFDPSCFFNSFPPTPISPQGATEPTVPETLNIASPASASALAPSLAHVSGIRSTSSSSSSPTIQPENTGTDNGKGVGRDEATEKQPPGADQQCARSTMTTGTTAAAAAALSTGWTSSAAASSSTAAAGHQAAGGPAGPTVTSFLRLGGYTLKEAGITIPDGLDDEEKSRRMALIARELYYEETHPPVLPPSKVPDLPDKPPPVEAPKVEAHMTPAEKQAVEDEIRLIAAMNKKADQERNNAAAKKSRALRIESLENTRKQLNAKAAECAWLRLQIVAMTGRADLKRPPSEAWGGFDYAYDDGDPGPSTARRVRRKATSSVSLAEGSGGSAGDTVLGAGDPGLVDDAGEEGNSEPRADVEEVEEGVVPLCVKRGMTAEMQARVKKYEERMDDRRKERDSAKRKEKAEEDKLRKQQRAEEDERRQQQHDHAHLYYQPPPAPPQPGLGGSLVNR